MTKEEQAILSYFVDMMEENGQTYTLTRINFDDVTLKNIQKKYDVIIEKNKSKLFNKLLSHEYIQYSYIGGGEEYSGMQITLKGLGVINSIKVKQEQLKKRNLLKKISDGIENHKGLATFIGIMLTIITLFSSIWSVNDK